jgi:PAT family beta-lactamase induction signal transducer AmpG
MMQDLGWSQAEYGQMVGGLPLIFGLAGSVGGGFLADRLGHRTTVAVSSMAIGLLWIVFSRAGSLWPDRTFIVTITCAQELFFGTLSAAVFALCMSVSWPRVAATQFTAYMALLNLSRTLGARAAGVLNEYLGFAGTYLAVGALQIAVIALLFRLDPHQNRRELDEQAEST